MRRLTFRQWVGYAGFAVVLVVTVAVAVWSGDILRAGLDPQVPFQTYEPPPAPDYRSASSWALQDDGRSDQAAVFFVMPTTFDGGSGWNGAIDDARANAYMRRVVLPNYASPFAREAKVSAPLYRQASLYTRLTLRDDAREARAFAYEDVKRAFDLWLANHPTGPIVIAGVEQGGELAARLVREELQAHPALKSRLAAAYLIETLISPEMFDRRIAPCDAPDQTGCLVAWMSVRNGDESAARRALRRALEWNGRGELVELKTAPICVNPVTGAIGQPRAEARQHSGATNATGLEWGARPALTGRLVSTECRGGLLWHSAPDADFLTAGGSWADRRKIVPYNLFYGDIERDVATRVAAWRRKAASEPRPPVSVAPLARSG
ncbi:MAG: DUF3089 domain-containing protein [Brevundimonas sp.]|jgi:hypothetical protein|uniref:DUF3089 domain-containing protein n=1 Tax=Brevundimonas sp. TaxID=1871086 RepID=UPI000DB5ED1E|nr:DUF3089 domain-containing protein [Brevundimonas sp.]PZT97977.1 MAG: DUF3089 domain-containing protein [Brevundimonas sp.]